MSNPLDSLTGTITCGVILTLIVMAYLHLL